MERRTKRALRALGGMAAAGFIGLNVLAFSHAYAMTHFDANSGTQERTKIGRAPLLKTLRVLLCGIRVPRPTGERQPEELAADCRRVTLAGADGVTLEAWACERGGATPLVVLFHGYAAEKGALLPEARAFLSLGASVMLVDFRGSGGSSASYTTIGVREAEDVAAAVRYASVRLPHRSLVLFGQSMGAVAILRAVNDRLVAPDAVILEAAFDSLLHTVRNRFASMGVPSFPSAELMVFWGGIQYGFDGFAHNPVDYARELRCPALFQHGAGDTRVSVAESRRVFDAAPNPKAYCEYAGAAHESYVAKSPEEWRREVSGFLRGVGVFPR